MREGSCAAGGYSLLELVTAMAIAGIVAGLAMAFHRDFGKALREAWKRTSGRQAEMAFLSTVERGFLEGQGLVEMGPRRLVFRTRTGREILLEVEDSLTWNGRPAPLTAEEFEFRAGGPDCAPPWDWMELRDEDPECRALLDTLDGNRDGIITGDELDRDGDGLLRGPERRYVRWVELRWRPGPESPWRALALHPRQRVPTEEGGDFP